MKRAIIILFLTFLASAVSPASAQLRRDLYFFIGKVVRVDTDKREIRILDYESGDEKEFTVEGSMANAVLDAEVVINVYRNTRLIKSIIPVKKK